MLWTVSGKKKRESQSWLHYRDDIVTDSLFEFWVVKVRMCKNIVAWSLKMFCSLDAPNSIKQSQQYSGSYISSIIINDFVLDMRVKNWYPFLSTTITSTCFDRVHVCMHHVSMAEPIHLKFQTTEVLTAAVFPPEFDALPTRHSLLRKVFWCVCLCFFPRPVWPAVSPVLRRSLVDFESC